MADQTANRTALATRSPAQLGGGRPRSLEEILADLRAGRISLAVAIQEMTARYESFGDTPQSAAAAAANVMQAAGFQPPQATGSRGPAPRFDPTRAFAPKEGEFIVPTPEPEFAPPPFPALTSPFADRPAFGTDPGQSFLSDRSRSREGRGGIFNSFVASQFPDLPSRFQTAINQEGDPLSASFVLGRTQFPTTGPTTFREFLAQNPTAFNRQGFTDSLDALAPLFDPEGILTDSQRIGRNFFLGSGGASNVIRQSFGSGFSPLFSDAVDRFVTNSIRRFRDVNPGAGDDELFGTFLNNRQLQGGGFQRQPVFGGR